MIRPQPRIIDRYFPSSMLDSACPSDWIRKEQLDSVLLGFDSSAPYRKAVCLLSCFDDVVHLAVASQDSKSPSFLHPFENLCEAPRTLPVHSAVTRSDPHAVQIDLSPSKATVITPNGRKDMAGPLSQTLPWLKTVAAGESDVLIRASGETPSGAVVTLASYFKPGAAVYLGPVQQGEDN
jgi:hypothetical protein